VINRLIAPFVGKGWGGNKIVLKVFPILWKLFGNNQEIETLEGFKVSLERASPFMVAVISSTKTYEPFETGLFKSYLREGMVVADIGASLGWYSLVASKIVGNKGKIYAFEPQPSSYASLLKNIELNNCKNIVPIRKAVSNKKGIAKLHLSESNAEMSSFAKVGRDFVEVETTRLDAYSDKFDIVKMDIEGAEPLAFDSLGNIPRVLFTELQPRRLKQLGFSPEEFLERLQKYFDIQVLNSKTKKTKIVTQYRDVEESIVGSDTNLFCVRKEAK